MSLLKDKEKILEKAKTGTDKLIELINREGWQKIGDKPCDMYTLNVDGKLAAKGVSEMKFPIDEIFKYIDTPENFRKLNDNCKEFKRL